MPQQRTKIFMNMNPMNESEDSLPEWMEEIIDGIQITDGVDHFTWAKGEREEYSVEMKYGGEVLKFRAGTDGERHGVQYDGNVHDMTTPDQIQWWVAGELLERLNAERKRAKEREGELVQRLIDRREAFERLLARVMVMGRGL